jgi:hypothetical protein
MGSAQRRRWKVRDSIFSPWRELPGEFTAAEIWEKHKKGEFSVAIPVDEPAAKPEKDPADG